MTIKLRCSVRVVTLWRPWDYAIAALGKRVENRDWCPKGLQLPWMMAVRGGKRWEREAFPFVQEATWPAGRVCAVAEVVAYEAPGVGTHDKWRALQGWGWRLGRVAPLAEPIVWPPVERASDDRRSMQGLVHLDVVRWEYDRDLLDALGRAWSRVHGPEKPLGHL